MKLNKKWILIAIIAVVVAGAAILAAFLLTPKTPDYTFPPYVDTYEKSKSYTSQDPNIVLDGVLNDAAWNDQRWLDVKHVTDSALGVKMTSYFGTDGLYMAFDVDDYGVFFDEKRDAAYNSGIQLYISSMDGAKNITGCGYEISLAAGGQVKIKQYTGKQYDLYLGRVYSESVIKGELNSDDAKGYTLEAYIDYALLGEDCKQVFANAAIVRAMSETGSDRQWYSFGQNDRGAAWTRAETWWTFGEEGLVAYDVTAETGEQGAIDGKPYVPGGDDYTFRIIPNQGYYAKQVMLGEEDMTSALYYIDGKTYCTTENVQSDLDIQVTFAQVPDVQMNVSGKVSSADGTVTGAKVWAVLGGYEQALSVDAEGNYSGTIPAAEGMQLFVTAEGFVPKALAAQEGESNILLEKMYFGENTETERKTANQTVWDLNRLYLDRVRLKTTDYAMELVNSQIYSKSIYASAKLKTDVKQGVDTRAGFSFYVNKELSLFVALTMNGEVNEFNPEGKINCTIQLITEVNGERFWGPGGIIVPIENQERIMEMAAGEGVPVSVHYSKGAIDVWVDGQQIGYGLYSKDENGYNRLSEDTAVAVGLQCWGSRAVYEDLHFDGNYPERMYPSAPNWDLSRLGSGIAVSQLGDKLSSAMLTSKFYNKLCMTANVPLIARSGADLRAGFMLKNPQGKEVFVALTANGEKNTNNPNGDLYYTVQVISGGYASWKVEGKITDTRTWKEIMELAKNGGVPMTVYAQNGKLTIGINGYVVAENVTPLDKDGKPIFAGNTSVAPGLATAGTTLTFTGVSYSTEKPTLKDPSLRDWDVSKADEGVYSRTSEGGFAGLLLTESYAQNAGISANLPLIAQEGKDIRAGFMFKNEKGVEVFVSLTANGEKNTNNPNGDLYYTVQVISGGYASWKVEGKIIDVRSWNELHQLAKEDGIPFTAYMENGKLTIGINGYVVAEDVIPLDKDGKPILTGNTSVAPGLATAGTTLTFTGVSYNTTEPTLKDPSLRDWDVSRADEGVYSRTGEGGFAALLLTESYAQNAGISANLPLIAQEGKDIRAGFVFKNEKGVEVFVSLTANGEKNTNNPNGDLYYTVQVISGGYASWKVEGSITDIRTWDELHSLAANGGIPVTAYMENGKLTIGIYGYAVAENVVPVNTDGAPILGENTSVKAGLATAALPLSYTEVTLRDSKPDLKDSSLRGWDLSKLSQGEVYRSIKASKADIVIWETLREKYYLTSKITFPTAAEDVRVGYRFSDSDGNKLFVAFLRTADGSYAVQMIATPTTGGYNWVWNYKLNNISSIPAEGMPFGVAYAGGGFDIWVNGSKIGANIVPVIGQTPVFTADDLVCAGLECWSTTAQFQDLAAYDINDEPQKPVTSTEIKITEGYAATDKYVVLSARLRSLTELKYDWSRNAILSVSGEANWQNYAFQIVYGTSSTQNLIKLNNNRGYDGKTVLQEQWYNNAKLEKLFAEDGIEIKLVRMNTEAYLLVDMGDGYERLGVMTLPENAPTQLKLFAPNMDVRLNRVTVETGIEAVEEALKSDNPDVLVNSKGAAPTVIPGDYSNANYAVLEANIKALDGITYDWGSNIIVSVSGSARWADNYDMQILYGKSNTQNLVKLAAATSTVDGIKVPQEQWINSTAFEKPFTEEGMNIKVVRLNTWVYLLADMGSGYTVVGKMTIPETAVTEFSIYNSKTAVQISNFSVRTGEAAALKALDGISLKVDPLANAFAVPVSGTQWTIEGKISFDNFAVTGDYRLAVSSNKSEWRRMNLLYFYSQSKWRGQSVAQISGSWASTDIPGAEHLTGDGLWTRWVRDGGILSLYVSTDRENWTYVQNCDNCGTNSGVIYIFEANGDQNPVMEGLTIRASLPDEEVPEEPGGNEPTEPERQIENITLKDLPDQVSYRVGDTFQIKDASYEVRYDNGDVEFYEITPDMCSEVDMTQSGIQNVYVNICHEGVEAQLFFTVEIIGDPEEYEPTVN